MINFIKNHFTKGHAIALVLLAVAAAGLIAINAYLLNMTHGQYNIIDILAGI